MGEGAAHAASRSAAWVLSKQIRRWFRTVPPCTSKARLSSMPAIWSGGMSQAKWYSPESRPLMRDETSGTSTKRIWRSGGRPPQYSSCATSVSDTSGRNSATL
jgi:hypothetical protein